MHSLQAFDSTNFAKTIKSIAQEVSAGKDNGYSLTAKGISDGAELLKEMFNKK